MFGMSQQQQVALIQQMAQLQLMNGMQKNPSNIAGGKHTTKKLQLKLQPKMQQFRKIFEKLLQNSVSETDKN